jgi:O-antigen/teichoic acid export membrane protein
MATVRVARATVLYAAVVFAAAPFVTALMRVRRTGYDWRYVWVALAAFLGAAAVMWIGKAPRQTRTVVNRLAVVSFLVSTLLAVLMARLLGARAGIGIALVAIVYAVFFTTGAVLYAFWKRGRQTTSPSPGTRDRF